MDVSTQHVNPVHRRALALFSGLVCHSVFAVGVGAMIWAMYFGLSHSFGAVPWPWAGFANLLLVLQFPLAHSFLLTGKGRALLARLAPAPFGSTLSTTTYATVAALQLGLLFFLWTPSGIVWWRADGWAFWLMTGLYAAAWGLLGLSILNSGWKLQSGALGWLALFSGRKPIFPDMPEWGLYRIVRHPIYVSFALTLWAVPTWTPDQLTLALILTAYCLIAPLHKERRFLAIHGGRYAAYRRRVPYWIPGLKGSGESG